MQMLVAPSQGKANADSAGIPANQHHRFATTRTHHSINTRHTYHLAMLRTATHISWQHHTPAADAQHTATQCNLHHLNIVCTHPTEPNCSFPQTGKEHTASPAYYTAGKHWGRGRSSRTQRRATKMAMDTARLSQEFGNLHAITNK